MPTYPISNRFRSCRWHFSARLVLSSCVATLAVLAARQPAAAFSAFRDPQKADAIRWPGSSVQVTLQQDGSDDISDGSDLRAIRRALAMWSDGFSAPFQVTEAAPSASRARANDGVNRILFVESDWPAGADSALGTTIPHVLIGGDGEASVFEDMDVLLNGTNGPWTTDGDPLGIDVGSVAGHELGHLLGLWHSYPSQSVMYTGSRGGTTYRRQLHQDDRAGIAFITAGSLDCDGSGSCPLLVSRFGGADLRLSCQQGTCQQGTADYGEDCLDDAHCQSGLCLDDNRAASALDPGACTSACSIGGSDCPGTDLCLSVDGRDVCLVGQQCLQDSDCTGGPNHICLFDFDGAFRCRYLCMEHQHCGQSEVCIQLGYGAGVCHLAGPLATGVECEHALQCRGLGCRGDEQTLACSVAAPRQDGGGWPDRGPADSGRADGNSPVDRSPVDRATSDAAPQYDLGAQRDVRGIDTVAPDTAAPDGFAPDALPLDISQPDGFTADRAAADTSQQDVVLSDRLHGGRDAGKAQQQISLGGQGCSCSADSRLDMDGVGQLFVCSVCSVLLVWYRRRFT